MITTSFTEFIRENISKKELDDIEQYADQQLEPIDVEFTHHFFQQLKNPRNGKEISKAELIGFFKRLSRNKESLQSFLQRYDEIVVTDNRSNINVPFVNLVNQILAKTVMRKTDFKTNNKRMRI